MKSIKGSKTEQNLFAAFVGESEARNKYTYFSSAARKEGYPTIAAIFDETANHEKEHAKRLFGLLNGASDVKMSGNFGSGKVGTTAENLAQAVNGEHEEHTKMYPEMAKIARDEGFPEIAVVFDNIAKAEKYHEDRFQELLSSIEAKTLLEKNNMVMWKCTNCGFHISSKTAPKTCPACGHNASYFIEVNDKLF